MMTQKNPAEKKKIFQKNNWDKNKNGHIEKKKSIY